MNVDTVCHISKWYITVNQPPVAPNVLCFVIRSRFISAEERTDALMA